MTRMAVPLTLIAAVGRNGVIGADNALPWRLPSDLKRFKTATMGKPVLMGRKTYQSIGRPLPGRSVIVLTRQSMPAAPDVDVAHSLAEALTLGEAIARERGADTVMVAGGGTLYAALMGRADRLEITAVDAAPPGDTLFPPIDPAIWRLLARTAPTTTTGDDAPYEVLTYARL